MSVVEPAETDPSCVRVRQGVVDIVWMNERRRRNALSLALRKELAACMSAALADNATRVIVLAGAGGSFCSGGDIAAMPELKPSDALERLNNIHALIRMMCNAGKPIVAAVEGWAVGAGLSLMTACDITVAASDARFSMPFGKIGLMPDLGVLHTLTMRIGVGRSRWLAMTGRTISAEQAAEWGLVDDLAPSGQAVMQALQLAESIAENAPLSLAATKRALSRMPWQQDDLLAFEASTQALLYQTEDFAEGARAFFEKRKPVFKGR